MLTTASTLFPKDLDLSKISPLTEILLRDSISKFKGLYVCHSESKSEIDMKMANLQRHIESGGCINADSSLNFLRNSFNEDDNDTDSTILLEEEEAPRSSSGLVNDGSCNDQITQLHNPTESLIEESVSQKLEHLIRVSEKTNKLLSDSLREHARTRKLLGRWLQKLKPHEIEHDSEGTWTVEPVLYNETDLLKIGNKNLDVTNYGLKIARTMWTDAELMESRLLPKREISSKKPLSPNRSDLFKRAIISRFRLHDEDEVYPAIHAVNQLCTDLKAGKRRRR